MIDTLSARRGTPAIAKAYLAWACTGFFGGHRAYIGAGRRLTSAWLSAPFAVTALALVEILPAEPSLYLLTALFAVSVLDGVFVVAAVQDARRHPPMDFSNRRRAAYIAAPILFLLLIPGFGSVLTVSSCLCADDACTRQSERNNARTPVKFVSGYTRYPISEGGAHWLLNSWWLRTNCPEGYVPSNF